MTLRDRLAGKKRRRVSVRVILDAATAGAAALLVQQAQAAQYAAELAGDEQLLATTTADLERARAALEDQFEQVWFAALDPDDYEDLAARYVDEGGELDEDGALPDLAAACAEDESLQDPTWWAGELASGRWNAGEKGELLARLVELNYAVPGPGPGKG